MKQVEKDNNEDYGAQFLSVPVVRMDERTSFFLSCERLVDGLW